MIFKFKIGRKKEGTKIRAGLEDALKAKAKLNLLEERFKLMRSLVSKNPENQEEELSSIDVMKMLTIASQGFGEVGDNARPTNEAVEGIQELLEMTMLDELEYGKGNNIDKVNSALVFGAICNLLNRSIRREHTNVEVVTLPPEMFMPNWMLRAGRESSLAT